jgi:hypothetical protein
MTDQLSIVDGSINYQPSETQPLHSSSERQNLNSSGTVSAQEEETGDLSEGGWLWNLLGAKRSPNKDANILFCDLKMIFFQKVDLSIFLF